MDDTVPGFVGASTWQKDDGARTATIDPSWHQGHGAFGGLLAASILRALIEDVGDPTRPPRTLTLHTCAPARGDVRLTTTIERVGSKLTTATARVTSADGVACVASASFAAPRAAGAPTWRDEEPPAAPRPADVEPLAADHPLLPAFTRHFELRFCVGHPPFAGADDAHLGGWVRHRAPLAADAPAVAALLDVYPPAALARLDAPRASATVDLTMTFHGSTPRPAGAQFLYRTRSGWAADGYATQDAALWADDGSLVGTCRQFVALLG